MNKLVIFDLDGTLFDTLDDLVYSINETCKKFGYRLIDRNIALKSICLPSKEFVGVSIGEDPNNPKMDAVICYYNKVYKESRSPKTKWYQGMRETVLSLKEKGYKLAIFTNKPQDETEIICDRYAKDVGFDKILGQGSGVIPKPDPTEIFNLMREFNVDKENTFFVGDGDTDVLAALRAGINLITVTYGYRDKEFLKTLGANVFASTPAQILEIILGE